MNKEKLESSEEKDFKDFVEYCGCLCIKLNPLGINGIPDRLVLGHNQFILFVEMKRVKNGETSRIQDWFHKKLKDFGFTVIVPKGFEEARGMFIKMYRERLGGLV